MLCIYGLTAPLPDVAAHFHIQENIIEILCGAASSRAARFARGAAASRQRARQRLATAPLTGEAPENA